LSFVSNHWAHHARFYISGVLALAAYVLAQRLGWPVPAAIGGDTFFVLYLIGSLVILGSSTRAELDKRADIEDEGVLIVFLITLAAIGFACYSIFVALNQKSAPEIVPETLTLAGAPLGWLMLHVVMAFHYANIFYSGDEEALEFPGKVKPDLLDFFYFSFVIGMTAQVSDVQVKTTRMRRPVLVHSIVSFFFNTVLIAMAVNAVVAKAG